MILYSIGDSITWGAELGNKEEERFSRIISNHINAVDCNNASSGVSNDYIFRNAIRDIQQWIQTHRIWDESNGWVTSDELKLLIGWTAPTRFEWWDGTKYKQERLWVKYDKWGINDEARKTEDEFIVHQNELIPSYIRTFNHIQSMISLCELHGIDYYFFNAFYEYENVKEPNTKIDMFGRDTEQLGFDYLNPHMDNMYDYLKKNSGGFLPRKHPTKESHEMWANYIIKKWL